MIGSALKRRAVTTSGPGARGRRPRLMVHAAMARRRYCGLFPRHTLLCALIWIAGPVAGGAVAAAQEPIELRGTVTDTTGGAIPGARVELSGAASIVPVETDDRGRYRFAGLRPGEYTLTVGLDGFQPFMRAVTLTADRPAEVDVVLQLQFSTEIDVTAADPPSTRGTASMILTGSELEALPSDPARLLRRLREMAGATGRPGEVQVYVNGFRQTLRLPPARAIQMIRISANPFAPEFAEAGRVRVEIITKPGSGRYNGDFAFNFNDGALNARNAFAPREAPVQMRDMSGYLGGPIVRNQWSFLAYAGRWAQDTSDVINATVLDAATLDPQPFAMDVVTPSRVHNVWLGADYLAGNSHTLGLSFSHTRDAADNQGLDTGVDLPERAYSRAFTERLARVALTSTLGPRAINETRLELSRRESDTRALSDAPALIVLDAFSAGGNQAALATASRADALAFSNHLTLARGRSTVKLGMDVDLLARRDVDRSDFGGTFLFGGDGLVDPLENYRRTLLGHAGAGPSQFWIVRGEPRVDFSQHAVAWFAQNDWRVAPQLTVSYGLRHDLQTAVRARGSLGPRAGLAWVVDSARKNALRAGAGVFHRRIPAEVLLDVTRLDGRRQQRLVVTNPSFFPGIPPELPEATARTPTTYVLAPGLDAPRAIQASIGYDRQLPRGVSASAVYTYERGAHVLRLRNINAPRDGARLFPDRGPILQYESTGQARQHDLTLSLRRNWTERVTAYATYTLASGRADSDRPSTTPADSYDLLGEMGPMATDQRHRATLGATLTLPARVSLSAFATLSSGRPFNLTTGRDGNGDTLFSDRPAIAGPLDPDAVVTPFGRFNPNPRPGDPIVPRNFGREQRQARVDLHLSRSFAAGPGGARVRLSADVANAFNRTNLAGFNGVLTSPAFGQPRRALEPRRVHVAFGVSF